jgi:peptidoglycan/xylan/chitin deacetylase (PgdA/CDA1 family)
MNPLLSMWSPAGPRGRLSVLIFHRVLATPDPLFPSEICARRFDDICSWLARGFHVLPLARAAALLRDGRLPSRAACITFDDGYADNHDVALPILQRHGLTATFFIATGFLDGGRMWNDTVIEALRLTGRDAIDLQETGLSGLGRLPTSSLTERRSAIQQILNAAKYLQPDQRLQAVSKVAIAAGVELPTDLMMQSGQVTALHAAGMEIGGHTVTHPILAVLDREKARQEINAGRDRLQALTQSRVSVFAYPNGRPGEDYDAATVELVRQSGFDAAVTTAWGAAARHTDLLQIPRFTPWDRKPWRFGLRMAMNLRRPVQPQTVPAGLAQ